MHILCTSPPGLLIFQLGKYVWFPPSLGPLTVLPSALHLPVFLLCAASVYPQSIANSCFNPSSLSLNVTSSGKLPSFSRLHQTPACLLSELPVPLHGIYLRL